MAENDDHYQKLTENPEHPQAEKPKNPLEKEKETYNKAYGKLVCVMWVSTFFIICQLTGAILSNSIAIFTDCAHLATDMMSFVMAMVALKMTIKDATKKHTFGLARAEVIGTLASMMFLIVITLWLLVSAIYRVIDPEPVDGLKMLITAAVSLCFNLVQIKILHQGDIHYHPGGKIGGGDHSHGGGGCSGHHEGGEDMEAKTAASTSMEEGGHDDHGHSHPHKAKRNMNLDAAFLHALGDMMLTIGVLIAATIIYCLGKTQDIDEDQKTGWYYEKFGNTLVSKDDPYVIWDPICTFVFSVIVFFTVKPICKKCLVILMEAAPDSVDFDELVEGIKSIDNVKSVHEFHLWQISDGKVALSCHVDSTAPMQSLKDIQLLCRGTFHIDLMTIQMEDSSAEGTQFECDQTTIKKLVV